MERQRYCGIGAGDKVSRPEYAVVARVSSGHHPVNLPFPLKRQDCPVSPHTSLWPLRANTSAWTGLYVGCLNSMQFALTGRIRPKADVHDLAARTVRFFFFKNLRTFVRSRDGDFANNVMPPTAVGVGTAAYRRSDWMRS
jgi:hypothetical protein